MLERLETTHYGKVTNIGLMVLHETEIKPEKVWTNPEDVVAAGRTLPREDDKARGQPRLKLPLRQDPKSRKPAGRDLGELDDCSASGN